MGLLIRNGDIVTADRRWRGDIRCSDGRIAELGEELELQDEEVIDAEGLLVFPGGVDPHVHLQLPVAGTVSADDFASGSAAALAGGTTTLIDFVHPERGQGYLEALEARKQEAAASMVDYGLHMAVTWWGDDSAAWIERCVRREGISSFKVYLAYKATVGLDDGDLIRVLRAVGELDGLVLAHAEHGEMIEDLRERFAADGKREPRYHALSRPPELEGEATDRIALLARLCGARLYVVHVTCRQALEAIARARTEGASVAAETCPQYLLLDDRVYERPDLGGAAYVIAPPIRGEDQPMSLWEGLQGGEFQVVATDHCPFTRAQKEAGRDDFRLIPGGAPGVEHRLALLWTYGVALKRIDVHRFVELVSTGPARLFGLYPRKGTIQVGADADLVLWDPEAEETISAATHRHRCDLSIYEGFRLRGLPAMVVAAGRLAYREGEALAQPGQGRYLARGC